MTHKQRHPYAPAEMFPAGTPTACYGGCSLLSSHAERITRFEAENMKISSIISRIRELSCRSVIASSDNECLIKLLDEINELSRSYLEK